MAYLGALIACVVALGRFWEVMKIVVVAGAVIILVLAAVLVKLERQ